MNERLPAHLSDLGDDAVKHLQALLRIDTTNPPGNETPAAEYLADFFTGVGLAPTVIGETPDRKNCIARLQGTGEKPPLLLCAHLDVVPAEPESWKHPPFGGEIHDGYIWGSPRSPRAGSIRRSAARSTTATSGAAAPST